MEVWQKAKLLAKSVYEITSSAPFSKDWALRDQIRRACISIPSNIAEGFERGGNKEFINFLSIAKGSTGEVLTQLHIAMELGYLTATEFKSLEVLVLEIGNMLGGFIGYLKRSDRKGPKFE
jgi:four helix bundle protein